MNIKIKRVIKVELQMEEEIPYNDTTEVCAHRCYCIIQLKRQRLPNLDSP